MRTSAKVAIRLPRSVLREAERLCKKTGESRSALIQRLIRQALTDEEKRELLRRYKEGYRMNPESSAEIMAAEASANRLMTEASTRARSCRKIRLSEDMPAVTWP